MTRKITISLPDDVAERLAQQSNVSAYVTESVRRRLESESLREALVARGFNITDEGVAAAGLELARLRASFTPELEQRAADIRASVGRS
jgi:predicted transcriptional regulator